MSVEMTNKSKADLSKLFKELAAITDAPVDEFMRKHGRLLAVDLAEGTLPRGKTPAAGKKHKERLEKKIRYIYSTPAAFVKIIASLKGYHAGERFKNHCQRRRTAEAEALLQAVGIGTYKGRRVHVIVFDGGKIHKANLKSGARLKDIYVVCDFKKINKYVREQKARSGDLKSGWARAAEKLGGTRGIPAWATGKGKKSNHTTKGEGTVTGSKAKKVLYLANKTAKPLKEGDVGFRLLRVRIGNMTKELKRMIKAELKKKNNRYR